MPLNPENAAKPGAKPTLVDSVHWRGGWIEREQKEWIDANGGIAKVRELIDAAMAETTATQTEQGS